MYLILYIQYIVELNDLTSLHIGFQSSSNMITHEVASCRRQINFYAIDMDRYKPTTLHLSCTQSPQTRLLSMVHTPAYCRLLRRTVDHCPG